MEVVLATLPVAWAESGAVAEALTEGVRGLNCVAEEEKEEAPEGLLDIEAVKVARAVPEKLVVALLEGEGVAEKIMLNV